MSVTYSLELHDTTFAGCALERRGLCVRFEKAILHESENAPGRHRGKVYTQDIELIVGAPNVERVASTTHDRISEGSISIDDTRFENLVPMPFKKEGRVRIVLVMGSTNQEIVISGNSIELIPTRPKTYLEEFE